MAKRDYLVEAAKQIRMALDSEVNEDYEAAFSYYKNGVDLLLNGVQRKWTNISSLRPQCNEKGEEVCLHKTCDGNVWTKQEVTNQRLNRFGCILHNSVNS